jgi:diaminohydroxyphosphoribosylaminopyrimidine deaminase/5-amino-6-(5-phosphoribosylamino)uracil reductase
MSAAGGAADRAHMMRALQLAAEGLYTTDPNPRVGCVLVRGGTVVGEGWHARAGEPHAEVLALREAGAAARGATAYVTLEPCSHFGRTPPCADALIGAGVGRVLCATVDPNPLVAGGGMERLAAAGIAVETGLLGERARALNPGFFSRFERGRPFVRLKLAMSLDGRTAHPDRAPRWITGEAAREDVQRLRAQSSAVLTGSGTVLCDDPRLDVRLAYGPWVRQPLRVVLDTRRACPPDAKIFRGAGALVFAAAAAPGAEAPGAEAPGAAAPGVTATGAAVPIEIVAHGPDGLDLHAVLERLAARSANEVLVECGARLAGSFLRAGLVDELVLYVAPSLLGTDAAPLVALARWPGGADAPPFEFADVQRIGGDMRLVLKPTGDRPCSPASS